MRKFLYLFLVIGLVGCGDITGVGSQIQGTYELYSIDGQRLPYDLGYDSGLDADVVIVRGVLTIRSNGRFEEEADYDLYRTGRTTPSQLLERYSGTVTGTARNLELYYEDTREYFDAEYVNGQLIVYGDDGVELVYLER